jgi:peptidoglycan/LPS O-acetylase OafA/YrhL
VIKYRKEIDGLRALAVVPVLLFHAEFEMFEGGYIGVDIFFVISGYLITSLIVGDLETNKFSILHFYERRARRILPAIFTVIFACLPFVWFWFPTFLIEDFAKSLVAVAAFSSNVLFWIESGYFDIAAAQKPLLHTWSLGVEEQFYILFPLFLISIWSRGKRILAILVCFLIVASLLASEWGWRNAPSANFYLLPGRAWELLLGSIVALSINTRSVHHNISRFKVNALTLLGFALIGFALFTFDHETPFPGLFAVIPTAGTALIILYASERDWVGKLLSHKVFVGLGLISYSTYLWHQPLFAIARVRQLGDVKDYQYVIMMLVSVILAYLTWKYVEKPFRNSSKIARRQIFVSSFVASTLVILVGLSGYFGSDQIAALKGEALYESGGKHIVGIPGKSQFVIESAQGGEAVVQTREREGHKKISALILGDSHATDLYRALIQTSLTEDIYFTTMYLEPFCLSHFRSKTEYRSKVKSVDKAKCDKQLEEFLRGSSLEAADLVIYAPRWFEKKATYFPDFLAWLRAEGKQVIVGERTAEFNDVLLVAHAFFKNGGDSPAEFNRFLAGNRDNRFDAFNGRLRKMAKRLNVPLIQKMSVICSSNLESCEGMSPSRQLYFYDYGHWTWEGALHFGTRLSKQPFWDQAISRFRKVRNSKDQGLSLNPSTNQAND